MEVEGAIYNIVSNAQTIFEKVDGVSVNKILQYYDLNKEEVNRYNSISKCNQPNSRDRMEKQS